MTRVLLVDDEIIILDVLASYLTASDYDITGISESDKAAEILKSKQHFDIMISDIRMTPVNGIELLKLSRQLRPMMPVIMITAFGSRDTHRETIKLGAFDCLSKPFQPEILLETVKRALKQKETLPGKTIH